jgi:putative transposase
MAAGAAQACRAGADQRGRDLLLLGVSTRRMDKLVRSLGITSLSKSRVSDMATELDAHVEQFRTRPLADAGPFTFVAADALVLKVREGGRVVPVHALVATGVDADGHRQGLGMQVTSSEDGAGWPAFLRDLVARCLSGVKLVTSDAHAGQRCRTHHAANLMSTTPKSSWAWVKALLHSVYDQADDASVHTQFDRVADALAEKLPRVAEHLENAREDILAFTAFPQEIWRQIWSNNPNERLNKEIRRRTDVVGCGVSSHPGVAATVLSALLDACRLFGSCFSHPNLEFFSGVHESLSYS